MTGINIPATIVVPDADLAAARADLGEGFFLRSLIRKDDPSGTPPTNWMSSGYFLSDELDRIFNEATWEKQVRFGTDWASAIDAMGLKLVDETAAEDTGDFPQ